MDTLEFSYRKDPIFWNANQRGQTLRYFVKMMQMEKQSVKTLIGLLLEDQTAPLGAVWSGSALFAQAYLSENFGSLGYTLFMWNLITLR